MVSIKTSIQPQDVLEPKVCVEQSHRKGEESKTFFRSERFYKIDGRYYFSTREGVEVGPYETKVDAEAGLDRFIDSIAKDGNTGVAKRLALNGNWAVTLFQ